MTTREERLERMLNKFILVCLQSEIVAQTLLSEELQMSEIVHSAKGILTLPLNVVYKDTISTLEDMEIMKVTKEEDMNNLTSKEEWVDMITDLIKEIKEEVL